ncbi:MAG: histidinol-phosphatase [Ruminococcus sp.]|nr:histidinol-phosphatase [Ruminococcus sp.]
MTIDFHSHILPGIDDGAKDIDESIELLDRMGEDGVDVVVATPHFYCTKQSIDRFIEKRNAAFESIRPYLKPSHPKILLGAEVLYHDSLVRNDDIERLTMQGTNFILLEMPYTELTEKHVEGVDYIVSDLRIKVLVAHIERYLNFTGYDSLCDIMELDVLGQINAESLAHFKSRKNCFKLVKDGYVQVMGTDMHRIERGYASYGEGAKILRKKFGEEFIREMESNGIKMLKDRPFEEIIG